MKQTIKINKAKAVTVEDQGLMVSIELQFGIMAFFESLDPHQAQALGDALTRAAASVMGNRADVGVTS